MQDFPPAGFVQIESKLDGIRVYKPAPEDKSPHQPLVEFKCPQCGGTTYFDIEEKALVCKYCGYKAPGQEQVVGKSAAELEFTMDALEQTHHGWGNQRKELVCHHCGAIISLPMESISHTCPFCASNEVIQRLDQQESLRPKFLIPFTLVPENCQKLAQQWLSSNWMTPSGLNQAAKLQRFTSIYLPFWTFDALNSADWKAEVGHSQTQRYYENGEWKQRTIIVWRLESGQVRLNVDDLLIPGSAQVSYRIVKRINGFDLNALVPYDVKYLAGIQAQAYTLNLEKAWELARQEMRESIRQACIADASTQRIRNFQMTLDFADESWRYILLPFYVSAYSYQGKVYQVMVNGQSGTIAGQRPVDWTKFWLVMGAILAPGVLVGLLGLVTIPLAGFGSILTVIGFILFLIGLVLVYIFFNQAQKMDDA